MKKSIWLLALLCLMACENKNTPTAAPSLSGAVSVDPVFGNLVVNFLPEKMYDAGFKIGDIVTVQFDGRQSFTVPFVTNYNQVGMMGACLCDYHGAGTSLEMGLSNANLYERTLIADGTAVTFTLSEQGGYLHTMALLDDETTTNPADYATPEAFANFRVFSTSRGLAANRLFGTSNPLDATNNPVRYSVADSLAAANGIQCEVDIADTDAGIEQQIASEAHIGTYCPQLYRDKKVIALDAGVDYYTTEFQEPLALGLRFMINHDGPYLIHCTEGKERAGFVLMLLESLAGATVDEAIRDYMISYENYYHYKPYTEKWFISAHFSIERAIWLIIHPELLDDVLAVDWTTMDFTDVNAYDVAVTYLKQCGLTDTEIAQLKDRLTK